MAPILRRLTLLLLSSALSTATLAAQEAPDPWELALEFGLNGASGNSSFTVLRAGAQASRIQTDEYELDFSAVFRYGTNDDKVIANDAKASVKFDWHPEALLSPFVFVDAARDKVRRLDFQANGGVGVKWAFLTRRRGSASLSLASLFDYQNFDVQPGSGDAVSEGLVRWSLRFKADRTLGEGTELEHVTFFQPVVDDFGDYVVEITNSLSTEILDNLSLAVEHLYLRDSFPPPGASRDDQKFSVLFRLGL